MRHGHLRHDRRCHGCLCGYTHHRRRVVPTSGSDACRLFSLPPSLLFSTRPRPLRLPSLPSSTHRCLIHFCHATVNFTCDMLPQHPVPPPPGPSPESAGIVSISGEFVYTSAPIVGALTLVLVFFCFYFLMVTCAWPRISFLDYSFVVVVVIHCVVSTQFMNFPFRIFYLLHGTRKFFVLG